MPAMIVWLAWRERELPRCLAERWLVPGQREGAGRLVDAEDGDGVVGGVGGVEEPPTRRAVHIDRREHTLVGSNQTNRQTTAAGGR